VTPVPATPVYRVGPGAAGSPVILHVPHAARAIPPAVRRRIVLSEAELTAELDHLTDAHTEVIAARAAGAASRTPWVFVNLFSRLVVDPERFPDDREELRAVGMGAVYTRTAHGRPLRADDPAHAEDLLDAHYRPYAAAMSALVDARLAQTGRAVVIDVHSYPSRPLPYEVHGTGERPATCLGTDPVHTPPALLDAARGAFSGRGSLALNTPFAGCYVPLKHYRREPAVSALMVEIRRDTYLVEPGGAPTDGIDGVVEALTALIEACPTG
jgi:N-formylglutamate amidohydrolase